MSARSCYQEVARARLSGRTETPSPLPLVGDSQVGCRGINPVATGSKIPATGSKIPAQVGARGINPIATGSKIPAPGSKIPAPGY